MKTSTWLISPEHAERLSARMARVTELPTAKQLNKYREAQAAAQAQALRKVSGRVAVLPVQGAIEQRGSEISYFYGGFSCDLGEQAIAQLLAAKDVDAIVLDVDSPGGSIYGVEELADRINDARAKKPIIAIANSLMASAAYWIGSSASQVLSTPGGDVGSIGVYCMHVDYSGMLEQSGIKVSFVKAAKFKAEANPYEALSDVARENLQAGVDEAYGKFLKAVARGRGVPVSKVKDSFGQGRCLSADDAFEAGMIDRIVSFNQLMDKLTGGASSQMKTSRASAEVMRLRHEQEKRK
jgi:capsid assembly protease